MNVTKEIEVYRGYENPKLKLLSLLPKTDELVGSMRTIPLIVAKGSPYEIGRTIGEKAKERILDMKDYYAEIIKHDLRATWKEAKEETKKFLPHIQKILPSCFEEMRGIAEGSGLSIEDIGVMNCFEEIFDEDYHKNNGGKVKNGCIGIAISKEIMEDEHTYLLHNEDWLPMDEGHQYLVYAVPDGEPAYISLTYGGMLGSTGFNSAGIAVSSNGQGHIDYREEGVPCEVIAHRVLSAKTIEEAVELLLMEGRASGFNILIVDEDGRIKSIETSAEQYDKFWSRRYEIHTNHYRSEKMRELNGGRESNGTFSRYNEAEGFIRNKLKAGKMDIEAIKLLLRDHTDSPGSICEHLNGETQKLGDQSKTISSMIIDLTERKMLICKGNPCIGKYVEHKLEEKWEEKKVEKTNEKEGEEKVVEKVINEVSEAAEKEKEGEKKGELVAV